MRSRISSRKILIGRVFLLATALHGSSATAITAIELLEGCRETFKPAEADAFMAGRCIGYLEGGLTGLELANDAAKKMKPPVALGFCLPDKVTNGQMARVLVSYLERNPARLHEPTLGLYLRALVEAFPCGK